jgi:hypothetical protein
MIRRHQVLPIGRTALTAVLAIWPSLMGCGGDSAATTTTTTAGTTGAGGSGGSSVVASTTSSAAGGAGNTGGAGTTSSTGSGPPPATSPVAVPTFQSLGLTWDGVDAPTKPTGDNCLVQYRVKGTSTWNDGLPLWYDVRTKEYRGSLVNLTPATTYEVKTTLDTGSSTVIEATTWSEDFPVAKTITLPELSTGTLTITESGSPTGYVVYAPAPGKSAVIDVAKKQDFDVVVKAKYVILRGLTLKGAKHSAILLGGSTSTNADDVTDVVIEDSDISAWGSPATNDPACVAQYNETFVSGGNLQSAIFSKSTLLERVVIQRNRMHHPSTTSNSWKQRNCANGGSYHPYGPQAISFFSSLGRLVIRYNEIYSDAAHHFNDSMGETNNFSHLGFPNKDSDIHGNLIRDCWDDGLELEGADKNVRVWGNYIDETYIKIALAAVADGPIYVWRDIGAVSRTSPTDAYGQGYFKSRNAGAPDSPLGGGRVDIFNNTSIKPPGKPAIQGFISEFSQDERINDYVVRNNLIQTAKPTSNYAISESFAFASSFDYDLISGKTMFSSPQEQHGKMGSPTFAGAAILDEATLTGDFSLAPASLGLDQATVIPNFTDGFAGQAPDVGAQESGAPAMQFGVNAYKP